MWYLGQPTRSGYSYDYDDPDDASEKPMSTGSDILLLLLGILIIFLLPYILACAVVIYLLWQTYSRIKDWIEIKRHQE